MREENSSQMSPPPLATMWPSNSREMRRISGSKRATRCGASSGGSAPFAFDGAFPATVEEAHAMAEAYPSEPEPAYISRAFLEPWEPLWTADEFSRAGWRRRIRRSDSCRAV